MGATAALAALGVVYGDIGTSPIYTIQTIFNPEDPHPVPLTVANVYGLVSLVFWSVTVIVTLLYVGLVLRADNNGEGGILSLITLVARPARRRRAQVAAGAVDTASGHASEGSSTRPGTAVARTRTVLVLTVLGIFGASLFLADSMITPAISVLSAVEGLRVVEPQLESLVIPITVVILVLLFAAQRVGTARVGRLFGPVMTVWFLAIGAAGVAGHRRGSRAFCGRCPRPTPRRSWSAGSRSPSSRWPRWCSPSPAPRRCTPTSDTSVAPRSLGRGCCWCSPRVCCPTSGRAR